LQGKVWRIGLMGESSTRANVCALLMALDALFHARGWAERSGVGWEAASHAYRGQADQRTDV
jgi:alanine-glyoxylate transaminase/serine-glyoxylate transaminase/serine-pyruvate transaminase